MFLVRVGGRGRKKRRETRGSDSWVKVRPPQLHSELEPAWASQDYVLKEGPGQTLLAPLTLPLLSLGRH